MKPYGMHLLGALTLAACHNRSESGRIEPPVIAPMDCTRDVEIALPLHTDLGSPGPDSAFLRLRIIDISTLKHVANAQATLRRDSVVVGRGVTDYQGNVQLRVPAGAYRLDVLAFGFQLTTGKVVLPPRWSQLVDVPIWIKPVC